MSKLKKHQQLFLTGVDPHLPGPLDIAEMRPYIIMNSLFIEGLISSDSQFNNSPNLRWLIDPNEPEVPGAPPLLRDLGVLVREGYLLPAIRHDFRDLGQVRHLHKEKNVENVGSQQYVDYLQDLIGDQRLDYDRNVVHDSFRTLVLRSFASENSRGKGRLSLQKANAILDVARSREPLYFKDLNDWIKGQIKGGRMTKRDFDIAHRITRGAYTHNVPYAMGVNVDTPLSQSAMFLPIDMRMGQEHEAPRVLSARRQQLEVRPLFFLSRQFLKHLPAHALIEIKGSRDGKVKPSYHYQKVMKTLKTYRMTGKIDILDFANSLELYLDQVELIVKDSLTRRRKLYYQEFSNKERRRTLERFGVENGLEVVSHVVEHGVVALLQLSGLGIALKVVYANVKGWVDRRETLTQKRLIEAYRFGVNNPGNLIISLDRGRTVLPSLTGYK